MPILSALGLLFVVTPVASPPPPSDRRRARVAQHRALARRPGGGGGGRARTAPRLLLRRHGRRRLEDHGRRRQLEPDDATGRSAPARWARVAVAPSDPNVVYVGMGEACIRGNVSHGDGVYRSTDAGKTWTHVGLRETEQIGRVRVHPARSRPRLRRGARPHVRAQQGARRLPRRRTAGDLAARAVRRREHGRRRPRDGRDQPARAVRRVLAGPALAVGLRERRARAARSGSRPTAATPGRSSPARGCPAKGVWGRIGVAVSPAQPGPRVGDHRGRGRRRLPLRRRGTHLAAHQRGPAPAPARLVLHARLRRPEERGRVYVLNVQFCRSQDGGKTFTPVPTPHGDNHDLWIAPEDPRRMIEGNDGGANVSFDGGATWSRQDNQPTAQFYHVITDDRFPYHVYGAQQDNSTVAIASRTSGAGIGTVRLVRRGRLRERLHRARSRATRTSSTPAATAGPSAAATGAPTSSATSPCGPTTRWATAPRA